MERERERERERDRDRDREIITLLQRTPNWHQGLLDLYYIKNNIFFLYHIGVMILAKLCKAFGVL